LNYVKDIARCWDYVMENMYRRVSVRELSALLGYSDDHFCHIFKSICGISPGAYQKSLRMEMAARELLKGASVTEVGFQFGFQTPSGFAKAFRRKYGMSPTDYKSSGGAETGQPFFRHVPDFDAIGYYLENAVAQADHPNEGAAWLGQDFSAIDAEEYAKLMHPDYGEIGAWISAGETGAARYFFGPVVMDAAKVPAGMEVIRVKAAEYAVFTVPSAESLALLHEHIHQTWRMIFTDWLAGQPLRIDENGLAFELYRGSETYIYLPVIREEENN